MEYVKTTNMDDRAFLTYFEDRVTNTIEKYGLFPRDQKLLVAASGGKDSTVLLYVLKKLGHDVEAITINAHIGCYSDESLENLKKFCDVEDIKLTEISLEKEFGYKLCHIMAIMEEKGFNKTSCSICGALRRYLLNKYAKKMNAEILLTGHNLDDEAEAIMMTLFAGNPKLIARIGPLTKSKHETFVKRAKPLYFIFEDDVERYSKIKNFEVHYGWCPCSVKASRRFYAELGINPEKKFNLTANVIKKNADLRGYFASDTVTTCSMCNEPSSHKLCQTCTIISTIKDPETKKLDVSGAMKKYEVEHNTCEPELIKIK